ncbi:MAG: M56 family metallopeptidase, partial [Clostridia bacterium]|nr:M56 family metallopeptidase [Clostridia bacterium]
LWGIGIGVMLLYAVGSRYLLGRRVAVSVPDEEERVRLCDEIDTPFILGMIRPHIYLPSSLGEEEKKYVLAHERAHIQRKDHIWKLIGFSALTLHWFNPFCWLAYVLFCRDIELACDEKVIRSGTAEYKKAYSNALLVCSLPREKKIFCPLAFGEVGVKDRIRAVLRYKKPAKWMIAVAVLATLAIIVFFMTDQKVLPDADKIFNKTYDPFQNIYASPPLVESDYEVQYLSEITVTEDGWLVMGEDETFGTLQEWELTKDNFDVLFREQKKNENGPWSWPEDEASIRRQNYKAWRVVKDDNFYIVLLQMDGSVLLCHGYYDAEGEIDLYSDDSSVRWMVLLNPIDNPFAKADSPFQWANNIMPDDIDWISVHDWSNDLYYEADKVQIEVLAKCLRSLPVNAIYEGKYIDHEVSAMVMCSGREYLLQYADGLTRIIFGEGSDTLYPDKIWVIEDENLSQWMEQWHIMSAVETVQWEYQPQLSSQYPAFPVFFDFAYKTLNLSGPNGTRKMIVGGMVDGSQIYSEGNGFCWSPMMEEADAEKELVALTSEVKIEVTDEAGETFRGTLYFEVNDLMDGDPIRSAASSSVFPLYTVRLESEDLYIAENPEGEGILLQKIN